MARGFYLILYVCILFSFAATEAPTPRCEGANRVYECRSNWDTGTCVDRYNSPPILPTPEDQCRCYCMKGHYYENEDGKCVTFEKCGACPEGEVFVECGSACPTTCSNKDKPPETCIQVCVPGCVCAAGYRGTDGRCTRDC